MFRRLWTGLPDMPKYPVDIGKLGYFINEDDEIRSIEDPKYYFKYFIDKNTYYNDCHRFSFDTAVQRIVLNRLAGLGLRPVRLPLGASEDDPHVLVLVTEDLATADRVLLFIGETAQDLGILAHRVVGGGGGIEQGSILSMVRAVRDGGICNDKHGQPPAVIIANPGELFWWPEARRALSLPATAGMPRPSATHLAPRKFAENTIPGHEDADAHVASLFKDLLTCGAEATGPPSPMAKRKSVPRITAIGIAGGADALEGFLDHPGHWQCWGPYMDSLVVLGGLYEEHHIKTDAFRAFLRQRARAYIASEAPVDTPVAGPDGNDHAARATRYGCPVHSAGTSWLTELMFIEAQTSILSWGATVARDPAYINPQMEISYAETILTSEDTTWAGYKDEDDDGTVPTWSEPMDVDGSGHGGGDDEDKENQGMTGPAMGDALGSGSDACGVSGITVVKSDDAVNGIKDKVAEVTLNEK
ncbi:hypothetical protein HMPREF1624_03345 [Sporothrix schenckii ATCC 58251]|uniref:Arb2 domain-containing protein n=1 Tax=Sporothrix schenckii (strain ATCC 58251 / de Perez 2211183) TaxID=1391915 RepID=U7PYI3_SPOS1|nr:hypothetical protein HMPREF1624_03345 [Sporothrix schenckii ATCC 58251]